MPAPSGSANRRQAAAAYTPPMGANRLLFIIGAILAVVALLGVLGVVAVPVLPLLVGAVVCIGIGLAIR